MKEQRICKKVYDSMTEQVQIVMPAQINGDKRLFGGQLTQWIDVVAGVVARRHSNCNVTTACIDSLEFKAAARINSTIVLKGKITWVGHSSMEVQVDTFVEELNGSQNLINRAYLVMVALDLNERPVTVPGLELLTDQERLNWDAGERRSMLRKQRRVDNY